MNYEEILEKIVNATGKTKDEVWELIEKKRKELDYLISEEGAAHIIASELGIDLSPTLSVKDLKEDMRGININLKVLRVLSKREWEKEGRSGKVMNLLCADETGNVIVSLWDEHADLSIDAGDVIKLIGVYTKQGNNGIEIRVGRRARLILNPPELLDKFKNIKIDSSAKYQEIKIKDLKESGRYKIRGAITYMFEKRPYYEVDGEKRLLLSGIIDDGTGSVRAVFFNQNVENLLNMKKDEIIELFEEGGFEEIKKKIPYVVDMNFYGRVQKNELSDDFEIIIDRIEKIDPGKEVDKMLNKMMGFE